MNRRKYDIGKSPALQLAVSNLHGPMSLRIITNERVLGGVVLAAAVCCCPSDEEGSVDMGQIFHEEIDPGCGCIYLSAVFCSRLGAGRIGNMIVLKERYVMVEVDDNYDNNNDDD